MLEPIVGIKEIRKPEGKREELPPGMHLDEQLPEVWTPEDLKKLEKPKKSR